MTTSVRSIVQAGDRMHRQEYRQCGDEMNLTCPFREGFQRLPKGSREVVMHEHEYSDRSIFMLEKQT